MKLSRILILALILGAAILVRFTLLSFFGYRSDIEAFIFWGDSIARFGITNIYNFSFEPNILHPNYPPVFIYILWLVVKVFGSLNLITFKFIPIFFDLLAGLLIYCLFNDRTLKLRFLLSSLVLLNPAIFSISSYWGQVDIIPSLFILLSIIAAAKKRFIMSAIMITVAIFTKVQAIIFLPILISLCVFAGRTLKKPIFAAIGSSIVLSFPFLVSGRIFDFYLPFLNVLRTFPYLTVNAMNFWWPFTGGAFISDEIRFLGIPAVYIGLFLFGCAVVLAIHFLKNNHEIADIALVAVFVTLSFFFFATDMHERYLFPVFIFLPIVLLKYFKQGLIILFLLTVSFLANIFYVTTNASLIKFNIIERLAFIDFWWLVNGAVFAYLFIIMFRRLDYAKINFHTPGL